MLARLLALGLCVLAWLPPGEADAFRFMPFTVEFAPTGPEANQSFRVENNSDEPIAVEISMFKREMNVDGTDRLTEAEDDFVVFPAQIVLEPRETQAIRVQWTGEAQPERELAYRIIAEQLPIDLDPAVPNAGNMRILVRYVGSIYVRPSGVEDDVVVAAVQEGEQPDGRRLAVTFENRGNAHAILRNLRLELRSRSQPDTRVELGPERLQGFAGENILAQHKRRFVLDWPEGLPYGPVDLSFNFERASPR